MTPSRPLAFVALMLASAACASAPSTNPNITPTAQQAKVIAAQPDWFLNLPQDPNYLYAAITETSRDMQMAIDKAKLRGRTELATQLEAKIEARQRVFSAETGVDTSSQIMKDFDDVQKQVVSQVINGSRAKNQQTVSESGIYRAYVLMEMPIGPANVAMMQKIKQNQQMYTRFRATKAFEELERDIQKFEGAKQQP